MILIHATMKRRGGSKRQRSAKLGRPSSSQYSDGSSCIIPGLPDEVALCILARLPRALQARRRLLCHAWKDAMEPARMSSLRKTLNISEVWPVFVSTHAYSRKNDQFLFTVVDPLCRRRRNIPLPPQFHCHLHHGANRSLTLNFTVMGVVGTEVLIAAMASPLSSSNEWLELQGVYSIDGLSMKWADSLYSSLPTNLILDLHYNCASALDMDGGYLYVAGGFGEHEGLQGVERLNIKTRLWEALPDPHVKRAGAAGVVLQGLFYLIGGVHVCDDFTHAVHNSGEIWDPESQKWTLVPELWPHDVFGKVFSEARVVIMMDRLYALRRADMCEELMIYDVSSKSWLSMGHVLLNLACSNGDRYGFFSVCLLAMDQELWVVNHINMAALATKPTLSQAPSWRVLPPNIKRGLPIHWFKVVGVLQV